MCVCWGGGGQGRIQDFGKGGGGGRPGNCKLLKRASLSRTRTTFSPPYEVWGSPKKGGGEVRLLRLNV